MDDQLLDNRFWRFSLAVYAAPGVAEECLALQERHGIDVNLLLFCAWIGWVRRKRLTLAEIEQVSASVRAWHNEAVKPLRMARRTIKQFPDGEAAALRMRVKAVELTAEQIEQAMLFTQAETLAAPAETVSAPVAVAANLETFLRAQGWRRSGRRAFVDQGLARRNP